MQKTAFKQGYQLMYFLYIHCAPEQANVQLLEEL